MTDPVLTTQRLVLRKPDDRDTEAAIAFYGSDRAAYVGGPMGLGAAWRAHAKMVGHWALRGFGLFAITDRDTGASLGMCGPYFPGDWPERELGWQIWSPHHEGKGIAFEAAEAAKNWVKAELNWPSAVSYIATGNARSIALAERLGATHDPAAPLPEGHTPQALNVYRHWGRA